MDVAGVIAGTAAAVALVTVGGSLLVTVGLAAGVVAGLASMCLLVEDGRHCWFTLRGDEAGKLNLETKPDFRWIEAVGPLLAIPDLALSGRAALREATELAAESDRLATEAAGAGVKSQQASRELREIVADRDQYAATLARTANQAASRAADYQRMVQKAKTANMKLLLAREAVTAYGGTIFGAALYAYDPPVLAREAATSLSRPVPATGGLPPPPTGWSPPPVAGTASPYSPLAGLNLSRPVSSASDRAGTQNNPWRLLDPQSGGKCSTIPSSGLQLTTIVASRPKIGTKR
jgi:hypothetical protein